MDGNCVLTLNSIEKSFGNNVILSDINAKFYRRTIYALVGNNGAGKSTLLKTICGLLKPNGGSLEFANKSIRVGALIEDPGVFKDLSAYENLEAKAICLGLKYSKDEINDILTLVGLGDTGKKKVGKFSMGMKQRLGIALAIMGNPDILILDEPTNSLDPQGINDVRLIVEHLRQKTDMCIIVSSHNLAELQKYATNYMVLNNKHLIRDCTARAFDEERGEYSVNDYFIKIVSE